MNTFVAIIFYIWAALMLIFIGYMVYHLYQNTQNIKNYQQKIDLVKIHLAETGLIYNHSYKMTKDNKTVHIRIYNLYYNIKEDAVYAKAYICTSSGEIGEWCDHVDFLYNISGEWQLEDTGEWGAHN